MPINGAKDFSLQEFRAASQRELTQTEVRKAEKFAVGLLQPIRNLFGCIEVTSFVRTGSNIGAGPHGTGDGIDFVPCSRNRNTMARMHLFAALFLRDRFGVILLEDDHIHATLPGSQGRTGETFVQTGEQDGQPQFQQGFILSSVLIPVLIGAFILSRLT